MRKAKNKLFGFFSIFPINWANSSSLVPMLFDHSANILLKVLPKFNIQQLSGCHCYDLNFPMDATGAHKYCL